MLRQTTHLGTVGPDPTAALLATGNLLKTGEPPSHRLRSEGPGPGEDWERYWVCVFPPPPPLIGTLKALALELTHGGVKSGGTDHLPAKQTNKKQIL